jgi:excisionase family DNA binding protein
MVHEQTVRRWIKTGDLPAVALERKAGYRVRKAEVDAFLEARMEGKDAAYIRPSGADRASAW